MTEQNDDLCPKCGKKSWNADSESYFSNDGHGYTNKNYCDACGCGWISEYKWTRNTNILTKYKVE